MRKMCIRDRVCGGNRHEPSHNRITDDDDSAGDHGGMVVYAKKAVEQSSHRLEAGSRVGDKEDENNDGGNAHQDILLIPVTP